MLSIIVYGGQKKFLLLCVCLGVCVDVCVCESFPPAPVFLGCIILALITDLFCAVSQLSIFKNFISSFIAFVRFVFVFY